MAMTAANTPNTAPIAAPNDDPVLLPPAWNNQYMGKEYMAKDR